MVLSDEINRTQNNLPKNVFVCYRYALKEEDFSLLVEGRGA